jgi:hypothetical protein
MLVKKILLPLVAIAALAGFSAPAEASIIRDYDMKFTASNFDFGSSGFAFGEPTGNGSLHFHYEDGGFRPHLTGAIHINNAIGDCARMRMDYYDLPESGGVVLLAQRWGGTVCADDNGHHSWNVDLDPYEDDDVKHVTVTLEMKIDANVDWMQVDSDSGWIYDTVQTDVEVRSQGFDFGGEGFNLGAPTPGGEMTWRFDDGTVTPHLTGHLHLNNVDGECARMNRRYLTASGTLLTTRAGGTVCASTNGHHEWDVDLDPYTSNKIGKVEVQVQMQQANGNYTVVESETVTPGD